MSHDNEELIDYEDAEDIVTSNGAAAAGSGGSGLAGDGDGEGKKNFSGIHSTGFR